MNRHNLLGHLALALTIVMIAAFAGEMRRMERERHRVDGIFTFTHAPGPLRAQPLEPHNAEVLVRFRKGTPQNFINRIVAHFGDRIEDRVESVGDLEVIEGEPGETAEDMAGEYRALRNVVEYAEPNYRINLDDPKSSGKRSYDASVEDRNAEDADDAEDSSADESDAVEGPNDPMFDDQWSLSNTGQRDGKQEADIDALGAWNVTKGSDQVVIAVLDSGVDYTHPDLINNIWVRPANIAAYADEQLGTVDDRHGYNAVNNTGDPMDDNGHGTHCAGIIGAEGGNNLGITGINWHAQIMPLKFMSAGGFGTTKDAIECINYVINRKRAGVNVRIISASWGSTQKSKALEDAIRAAGDEGILFVAASGNASANADAQPHYPASYNLPNVISVAALNRNDELASFSNYGAKSVHIAAPGAEILSTWLSGQFEEHSGTSMATPEVAGVAGLVLSIDPNVSVEKLRERLLTSVDKLDALNGKVSSGGRLNAARDVGAEK